MLSHYSLERYGLTLRALSALGGRRIRLQIDLGYPTSLWPSLTPPQRKAKVAEWIRRRYAVLASRWGMKSIPRPRSPRSPSSMLWVDVEAREVPALARRLRSFQLSIEEIEGRKPRRERKREPGWIAVRARVAIQVQGETRGLQTVEDRILLVRAWGFDDAKRTLRSEWKSYATPWISTTGHLVRWKLDRIVGWYDLIDDPLDPNGAEVWSSFSERRLKPEYVWRASKAAARSRPESRRTRR